MIYIFGGEGFVGSAYSLLLSEAELPHRVINRSNYADLQGSSCDVLINANGNSKKYMATRDASWEFDASVRSVARSLQDFPSETYVFLSSGDVYPDPSTPETTMESRSIDLSRTSRYGLHKLLAEQLVQGACRKWLVVRMGGLVGPGLKKNAIFDMLTGGAVWLSSESRLQFIATDVAAKIVWGMVECGVSNEIVNLGGEGLVHLGTLHARMRSQSEFKADSPCVRYELSLSKLRGLSPVPLPRSQNCVEAFVERAQADGRSVAG